MSIIYKVTQLEDTSKEALNSSFEILSEIKKSIASSLRLTPGGALPYLGYTGTCRWIGYGFLASLS